MTDLCPRCAQLFDDCHPIAGQLPCGLAPLIHSRPRLKAVIAVDARTSRHFVEPILVTDFYRKEPS